VVLYKGHDVSCASLALQLRSGHAAVL
jgi:hypothetical protein